MTSIEDQKEQRLQELYEIADGAYGDSPWLKGRAAQMLRDLGHAYPVPEPELRKIEIFDWTEIQIALLEADKRETS